MKTRLCLLMASVTLLAVSAPAHATTDWCDYPNTNSNPNASANVGDARKCADSLQSQIKNISLTPGPKGDKGDTGAAGRDGVDGRNGIDGINGTNGRDGNDGLNGTNGIDGKDGINGRDGVDGAKGDRGEQGLQGEAGKDGRDGVNGQNGLNGTNGTNGVDGKDGKDGKDGAKGDTGAAGRDGINGRDGRDGAKGDKGDKGDAGRDGKDVDPTVVDAIQDAVANANSTANTANGTATDALNLANNIDMRTRDAVTQTQLQQGMADTLAKANSYTDQQIASVRFDLKEARKDADAGVAGALAVAGIPQVMEPGAGMVGGAVGHWNGQTAFAIGASKAYEKVVVKAAASFDTRGNAGGHVGAGFQF